jgi:hypothetical protein
MLENKMSSTEAAIVIVSKRKNPVDSFNPPDISRDPIAFVSYRAAQVVRRTGTSRSRAMRVLEKAGSDVAAILARASINDRCRHRNTLDGVVQSFRSHPDVQKRLLDLRRRLVA